MDKKTGYGPIERQNVEVSLKRNHRFEFFRRRWHHAPVTSRAGYRCEPTELPEFRFLVKETRLSCLQVECQKLSSSASTWKPPLEMPSKHSPFWPYLTSGGLSLSSQTETVPGHGDAVRVVVCLLGVGPTGGHVVAMPGIRTTDLW